MSRLFVGVAVLFLVLAAPAGAQESAVLGGWALPEGAVVRSESTTETDAVLRANGETIPFSRESTDLVTTTMERTSPEGVQRALQRLDVSFAKTRINGSRTPPSPDPLLGREVSIERTADGWTRSARGWTPDDQARAALDAGGSLDDAEYPARPLAVGETVVVPDSTLRLVYQNVLDGPHRLTVRLDSLGTVDGAPVAYLTQEVGVEVGIDGGTFRMDMTGRIVRRLDWKLDVETVWQGDVRSVYPEFEIEGTMRMSATQTVDLPEGRRLLGDR